MGPLVDLATAYATQTTTEKNGKGEWIVYNTKKLEIYRLPADWTEKQVMTAIHFARKFELIALNAGVEHQKTKIPSDLKNLQKMVTNLTAERKILVNRNGELANELERLNEELDNQIKT